MRYILMADIIQSSGKPGQQVMQDFKKLVQKANAAHASAMLSPLTITLGDEFQGVITSLPEAVNIIFFLEEEMIKSNIAFELRYVLNYGEIETPLNPERAHEMLGPGLAEARKRLEKVKGEGKKIVMHGLGARKDKELNLVFELYQSLREGWPEKDITEIGKFMELKDYKLVAPAIKRDVSSVWRKEKTLRMRDYFRIRELVNILVE